MTDNHELSIEGNKGQSGSMKKLLEKAKIFIEWIKNFIILIVFIAIVIGTIYNIFATSEKDIPEEVFERLYKLIITQNNLMPTIGKITDPEWKPAMMNQSSINN